MKRNLPARRKSLLNQALVANIVLVGTAVLVLAGLFLIMQRSVLQDQLEARAGLLAESLATQSQLSMLVHNQPDLQRTAELALASEDVLYVLLSDASGAGLAKAVRAGFPGQAIPARESSSKVLHGPGVYLEFIEMARPVTTRGGAQVFDWDPPKAAGTRLGSVRVGFSMAKQRTLFLRTVANGFTVAIAAFVLILAVHYVQFRRMLRPLKDLVRFTGRVAAGDLTQRAPVVSIDEVSDLTRAFNHMVEELQISRQELIGLVQQAQEGNRLKSEFLANVSHEIRTPMNGILGMTELMLQTHLTPEQQDYAATVQDSALALLGVINDILDFSRIEAGKMALDVEPFAPRELLGQAVRALVLRARDKGIELSCRVAPDVPEMLAGDSVRLRQIVLNLVGNAVKFTERGEVVISVEMDGEVDEGMLVHFVIRDTGIGIAPERQRAIFDAFTQADGSTTRKYGGTGLGLTICARLVDLMGGRIWVDSLPGLGSQFHFTVRLGRSSADHPRAKPARGESLAGMRALIVDDNPINRRILHETCTHWEMRPDEAGSGSAALAAMRQAQAAGDPFRLVLLDTQMPELDGFEVARRIHQDPDLADAVILMMGSGHLQVTGRWRDLGIARYLTKPVVHDELMNAILRTVGLATPPPEAESPAAPLSVPTELAGRRILVAEDHPVNRKLVTKLLEKRSLVPTGATNGEDVLRALEGNTFDLILMDVQMPGMDGLQTAAAIREREKSTGGHIPILAMTAHALNRDRERCLEAGMDAYVSKPVSPAELYRAIDELLKGPVAAGS
ncbi:MAG: response regulator [Acidobacteriia bacterium]|nr:response regulator [Terriglobia bacterium]